LVKSLEFPMKTSVSRGRRLVMRVMRVFRFAATCVPVLPCVAARHDRTGRAPIGRVNDAIEHGASEVWSGRRGKRTLAFVKCKRPGSESKARYESSNMAPVAKATGAILQSSFQR
jgi:hypothetical protein